MKLAHNKLEPKYAIISLSDIYYAIMEPVSWAANKY